MLFHRQDVLSLGQQYQIQTIDSAMYLDLCQHKILEHKRQRLHADTPQGDTVRVWRRERQFRVCLLKQPIRENRNRKQFDQKKSKI